MSNNRVGIYKKRDLDGELDCILEEFQLTSFGECFLTGDMIFSICETFKGGSDIELRKQKDRVDLIRLIRKKVGTRNRR